MRTRFLIPALAGLVALSACGGAERASPTLPAALADRLAAQSDEVAEALEVGDGCEAQRRLEVLVRAAERAISAERVPAALRGELRERLDALGAGIECEPVQAPPAPPPPPVTVTIESPQDDDDDGEEGRKKEPRGNAYGNRGEDDDDEDDD